VENARHTSGAPEGSIFLEGPTTRWDPSSGAPGNDISEVCGRLYAGPRLGVPGPGTQAAGVRAQPAGRSPVEPSLGRGPKNNGYNFALEAALPVVRPMWIRGQRGDRCRDSLVNSAAYRQTVDSPSMEAPGENNGITVHRR